jgi:hypothetical protein
LRISLPTRFTSRNPNDCHSRRSAAISHPHRSRSYCINVHDRADGEAQRRESEANLRHTLFQIIDGALNCAFGFFQVTDEESPPAPSRVSTISGASTGGTTGADHHPATDDRLPLAVVGDGMSPGRRVPAGDLRRRGEHRLKNIARPLQLFSWRPHAMAVDSMAPTRQSRSTPLLLDGAAPGGRLYRLRIHAAMLRRPEGPVIGRQRSTCDLVVAHPSVSRQHARLLPGGMIALIEDLDSTNGTSVAGVSLAKGERVPLVPGYQVTLGDVRFEVRLGSEDAGPDD